MQTLQGKCKKPQEEPGRIRKNQEYLPHRLKEELKSDQMTPREYIDPFAGEPAPPASGKLHNIGLWRRKMHFFFYTTP